MQEVSNKSRPEWTRVIKKGYRPQDEGYSEAQNQGAAISGCASVDSLRIGAQGKWFLNSYWRKSEQMFPVALLSSVGQLPANSLPLLFPPPRMALAGLRPSPDCPTGPPPACLHDVAPLQLLLGCSLPAKQHVGKWVTAQFQVTLIIKNTTQPSQSLYYCVWKAMLSRGSLLTVI